MKLSVFFQVAIFIIAAFMITIKVGVLKQFGIELDEIYFFYALIALPLSIMLFIVIKKMEYLHAQENNE